MMKILLCLALCAFATALPSADVDPATVVPESAPDAPDMDLIQASYTDAKDTITAMLQEGKDDSACRDLASTTKDEVTNSVDQQQKTLAGLQNGDQCNSEGQNLIDDANEKKTAADKAEQDAMSAYTAAKGEELNFGNFKYTDLTEGQCGTFFSSSVWQNAKNKVNSAKSTYDTKQGEANAAESAVADAQAEAKKMVSKCKCETKKTIEDTLKKMNDNAKTANTMAWNKAYHMECVLDGKATNNCNVPALPTVQPVPFADGVEKSCNGFPEGMIGFVGQDTGNPIWQCGNNVDQQFQLGKIHIGKRMPTATDWKKCQESGDGWVALCDYNTGCDNGDKWTQKNGIQTVYPTKCGNHWHNGVIPSKLQHEGGSPIGQNGKKGWKTNGENEAYSLRWTSAVRNDHYHMVSTPPRGSWTKAADNNYIMCIQPKNGCAKNKCGFN